MHIPVLGRMHWQREELASFPELYSRKIFSYVFRVRKYFYNENIFTTKIKRITVNTALAIQLGQSKNLCCFLRSVNSQVCLQTTNPHAVDIHAPATPPKRSLFAV